MFIYGYKLLPLYRVFKIYEPYTYNMAIPKVILAVERPSSTVVKQRGNRFVVIKRTSKRKGNRIVPVDLGTVGEIINGVFIPLRVKNDTKTRVDIKDYGEVTLCDKFGKDLIQDLARVWSIDDAKRIYVISLLRAAFGDVKNRDLQFHYQTSFASEYYPGVHLSEHAVAAFLMELGQGYSRICEFMRNRVREFIGRNIVVDGMLKDYNSKCGSLSEFSRKGSKKGSKDISMLYAFDPKSKEPIAARAYAGNILDQTAVRSFVSDFEIKNGMMIVDKGFWNEAFLDEVDKSEGLSYLIPLKQNSAFIKNYGMDNPTEHLAGYKDGTILYKKVKMKNGKFLYSFRDPKMAYEQEVGYVEKAEKKDTFNADNYAQKRSTFGLIVFKSKADLDPLDVYLAYAQRWEIETMFYLYKNIIDRDTVNVHNDYRTYATEFINFLSVIITARVKGEIVKKKINKHHSYKQVFKYLSKYKKARIKEGGDWQDVTMLKYIEEIVAKLDV